VAYHNKAQRPTRSIIISTLTRQLKKIKQYPDIKYRLLGWEYENVSLIKLHKNYYYEVVSHCHIHVIFTLL